MKGAVKNSVKGAMTMTLNYKFILFLLFIFLLGMSKGNASLHWSYRSIDTSKSHSVYKPKNEIVVAVIDTGIDVNHPALKMALWRNPGESGVDINGKPKSSNGIDDDQNGFIDDIHGWNFARANSNIMDNHGHGTHVSGIIAAQPNVIKGVVGIAPDSKLMVLKYFDPSCKSCSTVRATLAALRYAIDMNVDIINYSSGGAQFAKEEKELVQEAISKGIVFVAAAGNHATDSDKKPYYPADYNISEIISVAALNSDFHLSKISNFGKATVDIAAPGDEILSAMPGNRAGMMTGTSQATAFVSGVASLVISHFPQFKRNPAAVKNHLLQTGRQLEAIKSTTREGKVVNSHRALVMRGIEGNKNTNSSTGSNLYQLADLSNRINLNTSLRRNFSSLPSPSPGEAEGRLDGTSAQ